MAKSFGDTKGEAIKGGTYYKWVDGDQTIRMIGDVIPRYVYWKQNKDKQNISVECLGFDRDKEKFTNIEKDWFKDLVDSEQNCSWSYVVGAIDPKDASKSILIPLKKKLYQQILAVAEDLGDPTNPDTGWDLVVKREKTGSAAFNVEYTLKQLKCVTRALTDEERETAAKMPDIDTLVPRQTPEEQKEFIEKMFLNDTENTETDNESVNDVEA
jgi:hypothetical protein